MDKLKIKQKGDIEMPERKPLTRKLLRDKIQTE
jgi:hypothetical protein